MAEKTIFMDNLEFAKRLINTAMNTNTIYVSGAYGANMGFKYNKDDYINKWNPSITDPTDWRYPYKTNYERQDKLYACDYGRFGFDCVGLVKGILFYGWNGSRYPYYENRDASGYEVDPHDGGQSSLAIYGGATKDPNYDMPIQTILNSCTGVDKIPTNVSNPKLLDNVIPIGAFLTRGTTTGGLIDKKNQNNHCGIYVGDGLCVECGKDEKIKDGVRLMYVNLTETAKSNVLTNSNISTKTGSTYWHYYGRLPWVAYSYDVDDNRAYKEWIDNIAETGRIITYGTNIDTDLARNISKTNIDENRDILEGLNFEHIADDEIPLYATEDDVNAITDEIKNLFTGTEEKILSMDSETSIYDISKYYENSSINQRKLTGLEGCPYQYMDSVDMRLSEGKDSNNIGIKYSEKILNNAPILYLIPCTPKFLDLRSNSDAKLLISSLTGNLDAESLNDLLSEGGGRYYTSQFAHAQYYNYLNPMMSAISKFLGIDDKIITIAGEKVKIGNVAWQSELATSDWKFNYNGLSTGKETLLFYLDGLNSIDESFGNDVTQSAIVGQINGYMENARELKMLFDGGGNSWIDNIKSFIGLGSKNNNILTSSLVNNLTSTLSTIGRDIPQVLGAGLLGSLLGDGITVVTNGGKIVFPDIWNDSRYDKSYSLSCKFRSPDHDPVSIFLNVIKPYCKLLALTLPHIMESDNHVTAGYTSPFLVKAYCKGLFNIDYGMITGLTVSKGAESCWTDDGLPTQIDVSIDITDLYHTMAMSGFGKETSKVSIASLIDTFTGIPSDTVKFVKNTAYMDFLANMAGLNIADMAPGRAVSMFTHLAEHRLETLAPTMQIQIEQVFQRIVGWFLRKLN